MRLASFTVWTLHYSLFHTNLEAQVRVQRDYSAELSGEPQAIRRSSCY